MSADKNSKRRFDLLSPAEFLRLFGNLPIAPFLGVAHFDRAFAQQVRLGDFPDPASPAYRAQAVFEGVAAKGVAPQGRGLLLAKAKTGAWVAAVRARYSALVAARIIES
jgi:hypothetical protein